jgi:hypothetical protein
MIKTEIAYTSFGISPLRDTVPAYELQGVIESQKAHVRRTESTEQTYLVFFGMKQIANRTQ